MASNAIFSPPNLSQGGIQNPTEIPTYSSTMLIEEVAPPDGGVTPRTLTLEGSTLPHWGAEWSSKQKVVTTSFPGNSSEQSQQVLNDVDMPSSWDGEWRATMMRRAPPHWSQGGGSPQAILAPFALYQLFDDMKRGGLAWRVTWEQDGIEGQRAKIVRVGRCTEFGIKVTRAQDLEWSATFEWMSRGDRTPKAVSIRDDTAAANAAQVAAQVSLFVATHNKYISAIQDAQGRNLYKGASTFTLGQLEALASYPSKLFDGVNRQLQNLVTQLNQIQQIGQTAGKQPFQISNAALNTMKSALALGYQTEDQYGRLPLELLSLKTNAADALRAHAVFGSLQDAMHAANDAMADAVRKLRRQRAPGALQGYIDPKISRGNVTDVLAIYYAKPGDTPDRVSQRFYGTMDNAGAILKANDLPDYLAVFAPGEPVIIPNLANQTGVPQP